MHDDEHFIVSAHVPLGHGVGVVVVHAPAPLQTVAAVAEPALQLAATHVTVPPGKAHAVALAPSHAPVQGAVPAHLVRVPRGVPLTVTQWPRLLVSPQL